MNFDHYSVVLLTLRDDAPQMNDAEAAALQDAHLAHLADLHDAGVLLAAGPLLGDATIRGLNIMRATVEEAAAMMREDPAVLAGRLAVTVLPWMVPAGTMSFADSRFPRSVAEAEGTARDESTAGPSGTDCGESPSTITGIGGSFFKARQVEALAAWYRDHLGVPLTPAGYTAFRWPETTGSTTFAIFPGDTAYFSPGNAPFMVNFRVAHLDALLDRLRALGDRVDDQVMEEENGRFGWVIDPEGNRIELWEPAPGH